MRNDGVMFGREGKACLPGGGGGLSRISPKE